MVNIYTLYNIYIPTCEGNNEFIILYVEKMVDFEMRRIRYQARLLVQWLR